MIVFFWIRRLPPRSTRTYPLLPDTTLFLSDPGRDGICAVRLVAARGKSRIELDGQADVVAVPAYQLTIGEAAAGMTAGCGYVSDSSLPPRSEGLFKAEITQVDGRSTPLNGINRVHVASGRHVLTVGELIPSHRLSMTQNLQRSRAKQHLMAR